MGTKSKAGIFAVVFCVIMILPFVVNMGEAKESPEPSLDTPAINAMEDQECIEDADWMAANHMQLLVSWRDDVVRSGDRWYVNSEGQVYEKSLDDTCLVCHSNPSEFCDSCHTYENVNLNCWDCHEKVNDDAAEGE